MKITDIQVDSFGHWKDLELPNVAAGVTVIHGPNEAGKSTLLHLIRAVLYGFSVRHHARFVPPRHSGSVGGRMQVTGATGRFAVRRWLPDSHALRADDAGDLSVRALDGSLQGKHLLASLLGGVDDAIFRNVFAVGLSEMQHLATLSDTEAGRQLYGLAAGTDRISITDVSQNLMDLRDRQWNGRDETSIASLLERRRQILADLDHQKDQSKHWLKLYDERRKVNDEIMKLQRRQKRFGEPLGSAESRRALRDQWKQCRRLHQRLESLGAVPDVPVEVVKQLDRVTKQIRQQRQAWVKLRDRRRQLRERSRGLSGHPALLHHGESIQALQGRRSWIVDIVVQSERSRTQAEEIEFELQSELERLGMKSNWRVESLPLVTDEMIADLRESSRQARDARRQGEAAEQAEREGMEAVAKIEKRLASLLKSDQSTDVTALLRAQEKQVSLLRQRIKSQGQLDAANRKLTEVRDEYHGWAQWQLLPWRGLMGLGVLFSVGTVVTLVAMFAGFFHVSASNRWSMGIIGAMICGLSLVIRHVFEFAAGRSAGRCTEEIASIHKQIESLCGEIERIEPQLMPGHEPFAVQLQQAEDRWQELTDLQPLEQQRLEELQRVEGARDEQQRSTARHKTMRQQWRDRLRHHGLPETMTPSQFGQLAQQDSKVGQLRRRLIDAHQQSTQQQSELSDVGDRLQSLFQRIGQVADSDRLDEQIEQIFRLLQDARQNHEQRESLHRKWRETGREQQQVARGAQRLLRKRQQLVEKYGVVDSRELRAAVKRRQQAMQMRRQRDQSLKRIAQQLGSVCTSADLRKELRRGDFEKRLRKWESEHDNTSARLAKLLERRGEIGQQIKTFTSQRPTLKKRLQLQETQTRLDQEFHHWQSLAGISSVLTSVQKSYETDRQPETLAEASGYLKRMTGGRYQRIWTPFGESCLCVDDRDDQPIQVENLSRGTREQVFLSLRLALAAAYSRRGAALPLILDDVFVNFDAQRARDAAATIVQFASVGHQVLVFTCHDHIRDVFRDLGVDLRELPDAEQNAKSPQPVLPSESNSDPVAPMSVQEPMVVEEPIVHEERIAVPEVADGLPTEGDPELDHELLYGAPEYSPGYLLPSRFEDTTGAPTRARPIPPPRDERAESGDSTAPTLIAPRMQLVPVGSVPIHDVGINDQPWGQVAEYGEWFPGDHQIERSLHPDCPQSE